MSNPIPETPFFCRECGQELRRSAVVCQHCDALVHREALERISAEARRLEEQGRLREAHDTWRSALLLLPGMSKQADWIRTQVNQLKMRADEARLPEPAPEPENKWASRLGPVGPVAIVLAKSKAVLAAVFKLKFLLSFAAFVGVYWSLYGWAFGLGFAVLILIHELGHFADIRRRGLPAEMPVFLPGLGAYVQWQALGVSVETAAEVSLAGPCAGLLAAVGCLVLWQHTGNALWGALAGASAMINLLNLIPVWMLDGGKAAAALSKTERLVLLMTVLVLWLGLGQGVYFLVAAGLAYRLFTKDFPAEASWKTTVYFAVLLVMLGVVMRVAPVPQVP
ncbi:MAG TPA: hypothetical protein VI653_06515 [Steroidobacteraceae bacterium]